MIAKTESLGNCSQLTSLRRIQMSSSLPTSIIFCQFPSHQLLFVLPVSSLWLKNVMNHTMNPTIFPKKTYAEWTAELIRNSLHQPSISF